MFEMCGKMEVTENTAINNRLGAFVPHDVLRVFNAEFLVDDHCRAWVIGRLHGDQEGMIGVEHPCCPGCGTPIADRTLQSFRECKRVRCDSCGKYFTALTDTFLSGCHFDFREIVLLALLLALGVQDKQIADILKISIESVRLWKLKFNDQRQ